MTEKRIVVAGAGAIGCFVGGLLAAAGRDVTLLGRDRVFSPIRDAGLRLSDFGGLDLVVPAERLNLATDAEALTGADCVLVTVKTAASAGIGADIARHAPNAAVVSLQNGLDAIDDLRAVLGDQDLRAGMVPFNVVPMGGGRYHRATSGDIVIGSGARELAQLLSVPHLKVSEAPDITAVQWGKLVINLNNALNALSGQTIHTQLLSRDWRRLMADQIAEALSVLRACGITVKPPTPLPASAIPFVLRLPNPLFRRVAAAMLTIDPAARTSMAYDLDAGRATEIKALQGRIVEMADQAGMRAPLNRAVADLISDAEAGRLSPPVSPEAIRKRAT